MTITPEIQEILNKFDRKEEDFLKLLNYFKDNIQDHTLIYFVNTALSSIDKHSVSLTVNAKKMVKMMSKVGVLRHPQLSGDIAVNQKMQSIKEVTLPIEALIYKDFNTGLYKYEFAIPKNFMMGREDYDADPIANFLNLEVKEKKEAGQIYLIFIKEYSIMEYVNIDDLTMELKTEEDKNMFNSKKVLTFKQVENEIENVINKTVEFTSLVENVVKQLTITYF